MLHGLQKTPKDKRNFKLSRLGAIDIIPDKSFRVYTPFRIKNQGETFRCSGYAASICLEATEGKPISGDFLYGMAKYIEGDVEDGANLISVCKSAVKIGAIEESEWTQLDEDHVKRWWEYKDKYENLSTKHRQKSFFEVDGQYDFFDNCRTALWKYQRPILTGTTWYSGWLNTIKGIIRYLTGSKGGGHALPFIGQEIIDGVPFLVSPNSYGESIGDKGIFYYSREVVNKTFQPYRGFIFIDMSREEAEALMKQTQISLITKILDLAKRLLVMIK